MSPLPYADRDDRLSAAVDRAFGEKFTFSARKVAADDVDLPRTADATRPNFDAIGVFEKPAKGSTPAARGATQDDNAHKWIVSMPSVCIADEALVWRPMRGDRATRAFDGATYEVAKTLPDGMGRTVIFLTSMKR